MVAFRFLPGMFYSSLYGIVGSPVVIVVGLWVFWRQAWRILVAFLHDFLQDRLQHTMRWDGSTSTRHIKTVRWDDSSDKSIYSSVACLVSASKIVN